VNVAALYPNCAAGNELILYFKGDYKEGTEVQNFQKKNDWSVPIQLSKWGAGNIRSWEYECRTSPGRSSLPYQYWIALCATCYCAFTQVVHLERGIILHQVCTTMYSSCCCMSWSKHLFIEYELYIWQVGLLGYYGNNWSSSAWWLLLIWGVRVNWSWVGLGRALGPSQHRVGVKGSEAKDKFEVSQEVHDFSQLELAQRTRCATWRPANRRDGGPVAGSA
jgi:hypothetical protein